MFIRWLNRKMWRQIYKNKDKNSSVTERILVVLIIILLCLKAAGCGETNKTESTNTPKKEIAQSESSKYYSNNQLKVGTDIPAGEYMAVGTGYVEVSDGQGGILFNDNITAAQRYVGVQDGEYVKITGDMKLYTATDAPKIDTSGKLPAGQYKVGTDIKSGEYKIGLDAGGYYAVTTDARKAITQNQYSAGSGQYYVTVSDGQYLQIKKGTGEYVGVAEPKAETVAEKPAQAPQPAPKPAPPPKPAKVLNLGMTFEQLKEAYNSKIDEIAPETGWDINSAEYKKGDKQDVFMWTLNENVVMLGIIDKETSAVKEILITATPRSDTDSSMALLSYGLVMATVNPELDYQQRYALLDELNLVEGKIKNLWTRSGTARRGNVKYKTVFDKNTAMFHFTASAKDL